jgi:hypothetical protein
MEIKIDKAKYGKDIIVKKGDKTLAIDICNGMEGALIFAVEGNENKTYIKFSAHNQQFCEFLAEVVETLNTYHNVWFKLKDWVEEKMETCPQEEWYDFEEVLCQMRELEPKGDE